MGKGYSLMCGECAYGLSVIEGIGMMYAPDAVFYGTGGVKGQRPSIAFPQQASADGRPLLHTLVRSERIREEAFRRLTEGAQPMAGYGHTLYLCAGCNRLANRFYFKLDTPEGPFRPEYRCPHCETRLRRVIARPGAGNACELVYRNNHTAKWQCPDCGNGRLQYGELMSYWD